MTTEEFDKKKPIVQAICDLDDIIGDLNRDEGALVLSKGIGVITRCTVTCAPVYSTTDDTILIDRFKQLLLERKQELINEFEK